ncbi:cell wall hydrolase [Sphingomonas sp. LHG3406-1]|uniref:cell wall hydrolase n=1 Tax=Sphingomonas sp. LHG3406-1 TaxID=2804617 RepID=UPI00261282C7|nr:cell wall hydrolase [Sphingomonas sp. LHG3406-1]
MIAARRLSIRFAALRWETLALGALGLAALVAIAVTFVASMRSPVEAASVSLQPARAAALIAATSGEKSLEVRATGEAAEQINAALPFNGGPVQAAQPFNAPTGGTAYDRALTCLTQAVYYEAGFEPVEGRRAVAQVILNRMRHPAFPKSVCGVVYQRNATPICQFTFVCDGSLTRPAAATAWAESRKIAAAALAGYVEPSVGQATHYHANYVAPYWAPMLAKITQIGAHIFYRWPGAWGQRGAFNGRYIGEPADPASLRPALRPVVLAEGEAAIAVTPPAQLTFEQDKTIRRAANDVGGLMDPSKGWTLSIPDPQESATRTRALFAAQGQAPLPREAAAAAAVTTASSGSAVLAAN